MSAEITVKLKDSKRSMTAKLLVHEDIQASFDDPKVDQFIDKVRKQFGSDPLSTKTSVTIKLIED